MDARANYALPAPCAEAFSDFHVGSDFRAGLNLGLCFEKGNEPADIMARITFLVVNSAQARKYFL